MTELRPPRLEDAEHAALLVSEHWPEPVEPADLVNDWTSPRVDLERDGRIGDRVYSLVEAEGEGRVWIELHGDELADALVWAESRARERHAQRAFTGGWSTNGTLFATLDGHGYRCVRSSSRMVVSIDQERGEPPALPGIAIREMRAGEAQTIYDVHQEAFEDVWEPTRRSYEDWAHWFLQPPRFDHELWFVAVAGDEICGVAICHRHITALDLGWVDVLGVRRHWRRRGIGRALLLHAFAAFQKRGLTRAGLGVDAQSPTDANRLYESVGMRETHRFHIYEKRLA